MQIEKRKKQTCRMVIREARPTAHRFTAAVDPPQLYNKRLGGSRVTRSSRLHPLTLREQRQMALC